MGWDGSASGKRGRSQKYSEAAIQFKEKAHIPSRECGPINKKLAK
jgi:hypothetical protein